MIKVTIELLPFGKSKGKTIIATGTIINNLTGNSRYGNYDYELYDGKVLYEKGKVSNFKRKNNMKMNCIWELLRKVLKEENNF
jgi:hypothetical protein